MAYENPRHAGLGRGMSAIPAWMTPLVNAVERVIDECNPAVPSAPLIAMNHAEKLLEMQPAMNDLNKDHPLFDLLDAVSETYWDFHPVPDGVSNSAHCPMEEFRALAAAYGDFTTAMNTYTEPGDE